jgi:predicted  nucleic acid-binding Zn-ribbon protein
MTAGFDQKPAFAQADVDQALRERVIRARSALSEASATHDRNALPPALDELEEALHAAREQGVTIPPADHV